MSDSNDDLLNYELGEELDDPTLLAGDEDDLLLSDEELEKDVSPEQKALLKDEAEKWVSSKLKSRRSSNKDLKKPDDIVTTSSSCNKSSPETNDAIISVQTEADVSTSGELSPKNTEIQEKSLHTEVENDQQSKNDEVTSTNKEIEDQSVSQLVNKPEGGLKEELIQSSLESSSAVEGNSVFSDPREDCEERGERTNIKHTSERDEPSENDSPEKYQTERFFPSKRGRGSGLGRGGHFSNPRGPIRYPHIHYPQYSQHPNENLNPQGQYGYQPIDSPMGHRPSFPLPNQMPARMEFRAPIRPNFRPPNPSEFMFRGPRPDFPNQVNGNSFYGPLMQVRPPFRQDNTMPVPPQGPIRHRMPIPPRPGGIPPQSNQPFLGHPVPVSQIQMPCNPSHHSLLMCHSQAPGQSVSQPVIPRKVLINPNFKGGVKAATCQLMKDTQFMQAISSHAAHLQSDEELLRQQEEFIKKNRMHIEKRRYDRSPDRSRSRERSYSPPRRDRRPSSRERRGGSPRGRIRKTDAREIGGRIVKRRRSGSFDRKKERDKPEEEEDEETRAYRQEIEKQKAMREKILRDKEMRRRKAVEGKQVDEKPSTDEPPQKLKPIIVTESKIISLKKNLSESLDKSKISNQTQTTDQPQQTIQRTIPTAKILPETKRTKIDQHTLKDVSTGTSNTAMAVIKPVIKKAINVQAELKKDEIMDDDELIDEELLLAGTPSPPSSPTSKSKIGNLGKGIGVKMSDKSLNANNPGSGGGLTSSNRRVILKSSRDQESNADLNRKPIFDRLEKKIAVNESVKRKIQRIVIKNAE